MSDKTDNNTMSRRVVFIDQARTLAIMLMLVGHSLDRFLGEPWRSGQVYQEYRFVRGFSSALFLMVSGFSFVIASFGHFDDYKSFTPRLRARLRRIALVLFLGYLLHLFAPTLSLFLVHLNPTNWERFVSFDILQNIAFGLAFLHITVRLAGTKERFWKVALALMLVAFALAPLTYLPAVDKHLPVEIASMVNLYHRSQFPLVPYAGYLFLGSVFGYWFLKLQRSGKEHRVFYVIVAVAICLIVTEYIIRNLIPGGIFPYSIPKKNMAGNTFSRAGFAMLLISGIYFLGRVRTILSNVTFVLSKETLSIYFVHLFLVYGSNSFPSLFASHQRAMSPIQVFSFIAGLTLAMAAMAYSFSWCRNNNPNLLKMARHTVILGGTIAFFFSSELSVLSVSISLIAATVIIFLLNQRRIRIHRKRELGQLATGR